MQFLMNPTETEITDAQVIHQIGQLDPTHAVEVDGWFYATSNVGWSKVDDNTGQLKPGEKFTPPVLLRFSQAASVAFAAANQMNSQLIFLGGDA